MATLDERRTLATSVSFQTRCTLAFVRRAEQVQGMGDTAIENLPGVHSSALAVRNVLSEILRRCAFPEEQRRLALIVAADPNAVDTDTFIETRVDAVLPDMVAASEIVDP